MIETMCPGCERKLQVDDQHAGRQARCPRCQTVSVVPEPGATSPGNGASATGDGSAAGQWELLTPEEQRFGPVNKATLDQWVIEGRVTADCQLREGEGGWVNADVHYTALMEAAPVANSHSNPFTSADKGPTRYRYAAPHRGPLILVLGILAWVVGCPLFGIFAWTLGNNDLREMRAGRMDPSGMGLTQAGQIIGMINVILLLVAGVFGLFLLFTGIALR